MLGLKNFLKLTLLSLITINSFSISSAKGTKINKQPVEHIFFKDNTMGSKVNVHVIRVDLNNQRIIVDVALAHKSTNKKEIVSKIAKREGAIAAINGSFFHSKSTIHSAVGILIVDGMVVSDSGHRRTSIGITEDKKVVIGIPKIKNYVIMPEIGVNLKLNGINQVRGKNHTTLYTPYFGNTTKTKGNGREIQVSKDGKIIGFKLFNANIPKGGFVISMSNAKGNISEKFPIGTQVYFDSILAPPWNKVKTMITGSPQLVKNGKIYNTYFKEKLQNSIKYPNTRTAVGITYSNQLLLMTVTGKVTFSKLANMLKRLGARDALALDGGGSTEMYMNGKEITQNYRPVSNALIVKLDNSSF